MLCPHGMLNNIILTPRSRKCGHCYQSTAVCSWCCCWSHCSPITSWWSHCSSITKWWSHHSSITRWCWRLYGFGSVGGGCPYDCSYNCCGCVGKSNILCGLEYSQNMSISYIWGRCLINMVGLKKSILWVQVVRFSHWCFCGFQSSGMWWHGTEPVVSDVSKVSNIVCSFTSTSM